MSSMSAEGASLRVVGARAPSSKTVGAWIVMIVAGALAGCAADASELEAATTQDQLLSSPAAVWPADREQLVAETSGDGFGPPPAPGSTCRLGAAKYTLDVETRTLSWSVCEEAAWGMPLHLVDASRMLSESEIDCVDKAMLVIRSRVEDRPATCRCRWRPRRRRFHPR
jgi:hypothetical protein